MSNSGVEIIELDAGSIIIGTTKGGWIHAGERPAHRVDLSAFSISSSKVKVDEIPLDCRPPTLSEWSYARSQGVVKPLKKGEIIVLADNAINGFRGAPLDGRPRIGSDPLANERYWALVGEEENRMPVKLTDSMMSYFVNRELSEEFGIVPENTDFASNAISEIICIFLFGIIPSFMIPIMRGFADYALEGWVNLLFGGLCAGFVSGIIWRPRRPTWGMVNDEFTQLRP